MYDKGLDEQYEYECTPDTTTQSFRHKNRLFVLTSNWKLTRVLIPVKCGRYIQYDYVT